MKQNEVKTIAECVNAICAFAKNYHMFNKTPLEIMISTKYNKFYKDITFEMVYKRVKDEEGTVNDWLRFTQDKRWTPAWGLQKISDEVFCVFLISEGGAEGNRIYFNDKYNACALMILMEMEGLRLSNNKKKLFRKM